MQNLESNLNKMFWYLLTQRRNFIPLLSIYFLSLPNTTANQIGIFTGIWYIAGFLLEVPSGYISDTFGHKKTLVIAKICNLLSTMFFILWSFSISPMIAFTIGSIFLSLSFSFTSGTLSAFFHNTLISLWREKDFTKAFSKLRANVSLLSVLFIITLPFFTQIDILVPFYIALVIDTIGLCVWLSLVTHSTEIEDKKAPSETVKQIVKKSYELWFIPFAIFFWVISGYGHGLHPFRSIYLEYLGYPIVLIGLVMWISRIVWFVVWHFAHVIEEYLSFRQFLLLELILSVWFYYLIIIFKNPYVVWALLSFIIWYKWWVKSIITNYMLQN